MQRLHDTRNEGPPSILIWGASGSGKTYLAGTAGDRMLFISNGMGSSTLRSKFFKDTVGANPYIEEIPYDVYENKQRSFTLIENLIVQGLGMDDIDFIVIDDATAHTQSSMIMALEINAATNKSQTIGVAKKFDLILPAVQDYGTEIEHTRQFWAWAICEAKFAGKHLVVLAHERNVWKKGKLVGDQPELIKQAPYFTGADKNPDRMPALFDFVWYTKAQGAGERVKYFAITEGDESLLAKTRDKGLFPVKWENPNLTKMRQAWLDGEKTK